MKKQLPKLPNGGIDYSKIDRHNDFGDLPAIYQTPDDIERFIDARTVHAPVLRNLLDLRKWNRLDLTPTETELYFHELFDYIYDVFRVPDEETYREVEKWIVGIEGRIVHGGLSCVIQESFVFLRQRYFSRQSFREIFNRLHPSEKVINYHKDITVENQSYYEPSREVLDKFWIKCSRCAGQPVIVGDEAYMRVFVYPDRVYIFGCDDCSYTLTTSDTKERDEFVNYLKIASPVWHFFYLGYIHPKLEFTN